MIPQEMLKGFLNMSGLPESLGELPVTMMDPIYGEKNPTFTNYVAPGTYDDISSLCHIFSRFTSRFVLSLFLFIGHLLT